MAASASSCAHCGKQGVGFKRCSVCKEAWYCGAACQNANWKRHKKTCEPPLSAEKVFHLVNAAQAAGDWRGVLKWEGRMEELLEGQTDANCNEILLVFQNAHDSGHSSTGSRDHARSCIVLEERRVELLGRMQRFRDQGAALCALAQYRELLGERQEGMRLYQRARDLGAAHGFFSVECRACAGLGDIAILEGRHEEGVELLRNALAASNLNESDSSIYEVNSLNSLIQALFVTDAIDELESLVPRFREAAQPASRTRRRLSVHDLYSFLFGAKLHEARGRPQEAAREVRALLDLVRENQAAVQDIAGELRPLMQHASTWLKVLGPELGEEELIKSWGVEVAKLRRGQLH